MGAMRFMSVRELAKSTNQLKRALTDDGKIVVTSAGKPTALMIQVSEANFEETLTLLNHLMLSKSVRDMRQIAAQNGLENLSMDEIDQEIAQYRAEKRGIAPQGAQS